MSDLITRLRCKYPIGPVANGEPEFGWRDMGGPVPQGAVLPLPICLEAADEITRLQTELAVSQDRVKALEDTLRPFANEFTEWDGVGVYDSMSIDEMYGHAPDEFGKLKFGDLRRAAELLEES